MIMDINRKHLLVSYVLMFVLIVVNYDYFGVVFV